MNFKGTLVITDPCYLDSFNSELSHTDWWEDSNYGDDMSDYGFTSYIGEHTIIGDWCWQTYNSDTGAILGKFCADAGKVCVCLLDEANAFNPAFQSWAETHPWCVTLIKDFDGDVEYVVDEDGDFHIVGKGTINFMTA